MTGKLVDIDNSHQNAEQPSTHENLKKRVEQIDQASERLIADCGSGAMPFRVWQPDPSHMPDQLGGELIVLLHGGSGSWTHWIRNIPVLSRYYELIVPDLPGLGEADSISADAGPDDVARVVNDGLIKLLGPRRFHLMAFSWGCVVASKIAAFRGKDVKSLHLIGPASLGKMPKPLSMLPLIPRSRSMSEAEITAANRENIARLMIHNRGKIDPLAEYLQAFNTGRARFKSPKFSNGDYVLDALKDTNLPLFVQYGGEDAVAVPNLETRRERLLEARPDALIEIVPGVGHWLQYEAPDQFNQRSIDWIEQNIFA